MMKKTIAWFLALCLLCLVPDVSLSGEFVQLGLLARKGSFALSENGETAVNIGRSGGVLRTSIWTHDGGTEDITDFLNSETLSAFVNLADISADGRILAGISNAGNSDLTGNTIFRWDMDTNEFEFIDSIHRPGASPGVLRVSADGNVMAGNGRRPTDVDIKTAFRWTQDGDVQWVPTSEGTPNVDAISLDGQFVIGRVFENVDAWRAYRWSVQDGLELLGDLPGGTSNSSPGAVSENGSVIAGRVGSSLSNHTRLPGGDGEVFVWTESDGMVGLGFEGRPSELSRDGRVLVGGGAPVNIIHWYALGVDFSTRHLPAFVWNPEDGTTFLGIGTLADISADGTVAVGADAENAIIWDPVHGKRLLQEVLSSQPGFAEDLDGWLLTSAFEITDDGLVIAGRGVDPSGETDSWLVRLDQPILTQLPGDFGHNGKLTAFDIDLLSAEIQSGNPDEAFDLTEDQLVDLQDHAYWVAELADSFPGDANLDGTVEFADFLSLSNGFGKDGGWADGDFNASLTVDFADFLLLSANFGNSNELAASVPEPDAMWLGLFLLPLIMGSRRRKHHP